MSDDYSSAVSTAREYYNSNDADNFYFQIWGGEDIHVGLYKSETEAIADASHRTVETMISVFDTKPSAEHKIIDLGAGFGGAARWFAKTFGCHTTCLNLAETQNMRNREMTEEQGYTNLIDVIDGSFEAIPAEDNSFDFAWSQDSILHSGNREQVMVEVDRVLKPGGEFIFTDPMQANDVPEGVLQPVLDRLYLPNLGSVDFYQEQANKLGWVDGKFIDHTRQLVNHYSRVQQELIAKRETLANISNEYIDRMIAGLDHWIEAGNNGYLAWGILHFKKPS